MAADPTRARVEADAAASMCTRHYDRIYGYCLYKLGSRDEAEDAAQTTFLHAVRGLRRGVVPVEEINWLLAIARNVCIARYRTRGKHGRLEVLTDPESLAEAAGRPDGGDSRVGLEQALARIPEQQRRAILLREWRGLSYREIAAELGLSVAAVETLIFRARRSLAEILTDERPQRRRGLSAVVDLGGLVAALKSALGGASAAKVAAGAVVVCTALLAGPALPPEEVPSRAEAPREEAATTKARALDEPQHAVARRAAGSRVRALPERDAPRPASRPERAPKPKRERGASPAPSGAPADPGAQPKGGSVATVAGTATAAVGTVVEETTETVGDVVASTGVPLPGVGGAVDDVADDAVDVVAGASSLLP